MSVESSAVWRFVQQVREPLLVRSLQQDAAAEEAVRVIALLPEAAPAAVFEGSEHPATAYLDEAVAAVPPPLACQAKALHPIAHSLPWRYSYPSTLELLGLEERMAYAEIIGPEAPFYNDRLCLGLTLIGPRTYYPPHRHPATELYWILSGEALWSLDNDERAQSPGAFVLHPALASHAMCTSSTPLLALYTWTGDDITSPSVYL